MKNTQKIVLSLVLLFTALLLSPICSNAATTTPVTDDDALAEAISSAGKGDIITLSNNIELSSPIEILDKNITINGNNHSITKADDWNAPGENATFITAGKGTTLNLVNITLENSPKYGVQAYNTGYVILDNVTIKNCGFGGVLVNAGTVEVKDLNLGHNGREDSNNGIEIAKGSSIAEEEAKPVLKMNGSISTDQTTNVVYVDITQAEDGFDVINEEGSEQKVYLNGNTIVVADKDNNILFTSNELENIPITGETYVENATITINLLDKAVAFNIKKGDVITKEDIISRIDLASLGLDDYSIENLYSDAEYTTAFDFSAPITADVTLYAKLQSNAVAPESLDETPKTGMDANIMLAMFVFATSLLGIVALKRNEIN